MILKRRQPVTSSARIGPVALEAIKPFDLDPQKVNFFSPYEKPEVPDFQIGIIVGGSGSGKSTLLREFGPVQDEINWNDSCIADHFDSATDAVNALYAAGLNSVPSWLMRYDELSTGQRFRADLARQLKSGALIDEFTSVVDRSVAVSASMSVARHIRSNKLTSVVFATCHRDIIGWLAPDWIIDTDAGELFIGEHKPVTWHKKYILEPGVGKLVAT